MNFQHCVGKILEQICGFCGGVEDNSEVIRIDKPSDTISAPVPSQSYCANHPDSESESATEDFEEQHFQIPDDIWFAESPYSTTLLDMPYLVAEKIFDFLKYEDICSLRESNNNLCEFLDVHYFDFNYAYFEMTLSEAGAEISYNKPSGIDNLETTPRIEDSNSFLEVLESDILEMKKSILHIFRFNWIGHISPDYNERVDLILDAIEKGLQSRKKHFRIRKLQMNARSQEQILKILPYLDPLYLEQLSIYDPDIIPKIGTFSIDKLVKLAQWQNLRRVVIRRPVKSEDLKFFEHIEVVKITVE